MGFETALTAAAHYEILGAGTGTGTTVTSPGSANTKGSYATIGTTTFSYDGFIVSAPATAAPAGGRLRLDIAVNTGGADEIIASDIFGCFSPLGATAIYFTQTLPVRIPAGATVKARLQSTGTSNTVSLLITGYSGGPNLTKGFSQVISCTDWTNTDPTNLVTLNGTTQTGWVEVQHSTAYEISALYPCVDTAGATVTSGRTVLWDVGFGASGSENVLFTFVSSIQNNIQLGPFPCSLPAGTRLATRAQASGSDTNVLGLVLNGRVA